MKFSTRAKYGLRICFLIGVSDERDSCISLNSLVKQTGLSEKYLEQILIKLKKGGIINSFRGSSGGYTLNGSADKISINSILAALDDSFEIADCASKECGDTYCPNRNIFKRLFEGINSLLDNFTLQDMINDYKCTR